MNEPTEQEIIDNAPSDDWTHHSSMHNQYFFIEAWRVKVWLGGVWSVPISNELEVFLYSNLHTRSYIERIAKLTARVEELEKALQYVHDDLLLRADTDDDGCKVVNLGYGCWLGVKSALDKGGDA